jgi:tetratricopeptide (TPR) repeat protein
MPLYLIGDGSSGVPLLDGNIEPVKVGLLIERFPAKGETLKARVDRELTQLKSSERFMILGEPEIAELVLTDGAKAQKSTVEFVREENGRLSVQAKVYVLDRENRHVIATGFITCSPASRKFVHDTGLTKFVAAHLESLVLDPKRLDLKKLATVYENHAWRIDEALSLTRDGNRDLGRMAYEDAIVEFRKALVVSNHVSAAHNGLSWALLHAKSADDSQLNEGLSEAKTAVEQTEERDVASLDTLAVALQRTGRHAEAAEALRKALALDPRNPELLDRLESLK